MIRTLAISTATILVLGACATAPKTDIETTPAQPAQAAMPMATAASPASTTGAFDPVGSYSFSVNMQGQMIGGTMHVRKGEDGKLGGEMASDQGTLVFNWVTVEGRRLSAGGVLDNSPELTFVFDFVGDEFTGSLSAQGQQIGTLSGSRKKG